MSLVLKVKVVYFLTKEDGDSGSDSEDSYEISGSIKRISVSNSNEELNEIPN